MKFLVGAQLPRRLAHVLHGAGYDTLHTLDLPARNLTTDQEITRFSRSGGREDARTRGGAAHGM